MNIMNNNEEYLLNKARYKPVIPYSEELSDDEKKLDSFLSGMKGEADQNYSHDNPYGIIQWEDDEDIHRGLYDFCYRLPKGADLHAHDNTMIPFDRFEQIIKDNALICLGKDNYGTLYLKNSPNIPVDAVDINEALKSGLLKEEDFGKLLVVSEEDREKGYWAKLEQLFSNTGDIYNDAAIMEKVWEEGFLSCYEKGVILVEVRDYGTQDDLTNIVRDQTMRQAYYRVRKKYPDFTVRLIGCSGKDNCETLDEACETLRSMIRVSRIIKDEYDPGNVENFIIGLDLVSEEDNSKPLSEFGGFLSSDEIRNSGLDLFLHCGESLRKENDSVVDAYLLRSKRVGHALNLYRFPELMKKYAENKIAIEVCMMSNYRLGYVADLRLHPGLQYLINGIPVVLCSDDGLFMARAPMVDDFYAAILCWDLNLGDIKAICRNSITYSGLSEKEINRLMSAWEKQWKDFVEAMLKKHNL